MPFVGTATTLLELGGLRLLTDPVFDPPGQQYRVSKGPLGRRFEYTHLIGPAIAADAVGPIDVVLLSHDHHADNLDATGRRLLASARVVYTTIGGARRLQRRGTPHARGLAAGEHVEFVAPSGPIRVTAAPARHAPWPFDALAGEVIGFFVEAPGIQLDVSRDTLWHGALRRFASTHVPDVALIHVGAATFGASGPIRYSANTGDLARFAAAWPAAKLLPIHFEGWSHFREGRAAIEAAIAGRAWGPRVGWLEPGVHVTLTAGAEAAGGGRA